MQQSSKQILYDHLTPISKTVQVRRTRFAGHCNVTDTAHKCHLTNKTLYSSVVNRYWMLSRGLSKKNDQYGWIKKRKWNSWRRKGKERERERERERVTGNYHPVIALWWWWWWLDNFGTEIQYFFLFSISKHRKLSLTFKSFHKINTKVRPIKSSNLWLYQDRQREMEGDKMELYHVRLLNHFDKFIVFVIRPLGCWQ